MPEKLEDINLRSEEVQDILTHVPHWMIRWGNIVFLCLLLMLLLLSWFVKYPDLITSKATITTQIPPQKEYAKTTGKLEAVLVKDNDIVTNNQPLAIIENTANYNDILLLKSIIDTIKISNTSFSFPINQMPVLFLGDIESSYALFENSYIQYTLNKQLQPFSNEAVANKISITELKRRLQSLRGQKQISNKELEFKLKDLNRNKNLLEKGIISTQEYEQKQLAYEQAKRNHKNFESSISQLKEAISNANKTSKSTQINKTKEELLLLKNVFQAFNKLKVAIRNWEQRYLLKSAINGNVSFLNVWSKNQTVTQGDLVFTVIPNANSAFIAKLKTPAQNSGKIKLGQRVNIKLENYPDTEFGMLSGSVKSISLIPNEEGLYLVDVILPKTLKTTYNKHIEFKHEMRGVAEIITEDLRLIERFFYQFREVLKR